MNPCCIHMISILLKNIDLPRNMLVMMKKLHQLFNHHWVRETEKVRERERERERKRENPVCAWEAVRQRVHLCIGKLPVSCDQNVDFSRGRRVSAIALRLSSGVQLIRRSFACTVRQSTACLYWANVIHATEKYLGYAWSLHGRIYVLESHYYPSRVILIDFFSGK